MSGSKISVYNIAYNATDDEIIDYLQLVGPFKKGSDSIKINRQDKTRKVYGYFVYADPDSALSAIRNLNKKDFLGRELTIKYSDQQDMMNGGNIQTTTTHQNNQQTTTHQFNANNQGQYDSQALALEEKLEQIQDLYEYVENMPKSEKLFLLQELKSLLDDDRSFVCSFLQKNPRFTNLILRLQTEFNMNAYQTVNMNTNFNNLQAPNIVNNQMRQELRDQNLGQLQKYNLPPQQQQPLIPPQINMNLHQQQQQPQQQYNDYKIHKKHNNNNKQDMMYHDQNQFNYSNNNNNNNNNFINNNNVNIERGQNINMGKQF